MADPGENDDLIDTLRLCLVSGVGPRIRKALLERFGTARAALAAAPSELRGVYGVGPKLVQKIAGADHEIDVEAEIALCREHGIDILTEANAAYPRALREIHDPPGVLFVRGQLKPNDALAVGIVGTRHGTQYGLRQAERLAGGLARAGLTIISGLARGIDAAAHRGAMAAGGRTIAVLASGVMNIYPPEHDKLAEEVVACGALVSESPPRSQPLAGTFPQRNRIISGLSLGVIVVEAADRSGALITARHAMEQGREVFAVPGNVDSRASRGCHQLIRDGAQAGRIGRRRVGGAWPAGRGRAARRRPEDPSSGRTALERVGAAGACRDRRRGHSDRPDRLRQRIAGLAGAFDAQRVGNAPPDSPAERDDGHPAVDAALAIIFLKAPRNPHVPKTPISAAAVRATHLGKMRGLRRSLLILSPFSIIAASARLRGPNLVSRSKRKTGGRKHGCVFKKGQVNPGGLRNCGQSLCCMAKNARPRMSAMTVDRFAADRPQFDHAGARGYGRSSRASC